MRSLFYNIMYNYIHFIIFYNTKPNLRWFTSPLQGFSALINISCVFRFLFYFFLPHRKFFIYIFCIPFIFLWSSLFIYFSCSSYFHLFRIFSFRLSSFHSFTVFHHIFTLSRFIHHFRCLSFFSCFDVLTSSHVFNVSSIPRVHVIYEAKDRISMDREGVGAGCFPLPAYCFSVTLPFGHSQPSKSACR